MNSGSACMDRIRISVSGQTSWIWRVTSMPFMRGIAMSTIATSGCALAAKRTAAGPSPNPPRKRRSGCSSIRWRSPSRTTSWSSTRMTLIGTGKRNLDDDARAWMRGAQREPAADGLGALAHHAQPPPAAVPAALLGHLEQPAAIVLDDELDARRALAHAHPRARGAAVLGGIGQRLLRDAKKRDRHVARQRQLRLGAAHLHPQTGARLEFRRVLVERGREPVLVQDLGAQIGDDSAHRADGFLEQHGDLVQAPGDGRGPRLRHLLAYDV